MLFMLLLFFSTVEAAMCLFLCWNHCTAHCMCLRADLSSPMLIVMIFIVLL